MGTSYLRDYTPVAQLTRQDLALIRDYRMNQVSWDIVSKTFPALTRDEYLALTTKKIDKLLANPDCKNCIWVSYKRKV